MYRRYRAQADFLTVYIREAHPTDEWQMKANETDNTCYRQPRTTAARLAIANDFASRFHYELPLVVDAIENPADRLYAGWPERFYIITERGVIAYKGETGPFGFHPEEVEAWLKGRFPDERTPAP